MAERSGISSGKIALGALCILFSALYYLTARTDLSSNDGSQFALTAAIALEGRFPINSLFEYTDMWDYAYREGNYYSDRSPGLSFIGVPFIWLGAAEHALRPEASTVHEIAREYALFAPALLGGASVALLALCLLTLGVTPLSSYLTAVTYGIGSLHWKYSSLFMSHGPSEFFVIASLYLLLRADFFKRPGLQITAAFLLGCMPLVRYELVLLWPGFLFIGWLGWRRSEHPVFFPWGALAALVLPLTAGAFYHAASFGGPLTLFNNFYAPARNYWNTNPNLKVGGAFTIKEMLSHSFWSGLYTIFLQWPGVPSFDVHRIPGNPGAWGLFVLQPVLVLAVAGWVRFVRLERALALCLFGMIAAIVTVSAFNLAVDGGMMRDPRYTLAVLPLMFIPLGILLDWARGWKYEEALRALFYLFTAWGFLFCAVHAAETFSPRDQFQFKESVKNASLASSEAVKSILASLTRGGKNLTAGPMLLIALIGLLLALGTWKPAIFKPARRFGELLADYSAAICLPFIACFLFLTCYVWGNREHYFNSYSDTLRVDNTRITLAAQEHFYAKFTTAAKLTPAKAPERSCRRALFVHSPSVLRLRTPPSDIFFSAWVGIPASLIDRASGDIVFEIWQNGEQVWKSPPINKDNPALPITTPIAQATDTELRVTGEPNVYVPAVWCDSLLTRIPPPQEMF